MRITDTHSYTIFIVDKLIGMIEPSDSPLPLLGKTALVTGASRGIGTSVLANLQNLVQTLQSTIAVRNRQRKKWLTGSRI